MAVSGMMRQIDAEWSQISAIAILMSVPVVIIILALHRYLLKGFLAGTVDG